MKISRDETVLESEDLPMPRYLTEISIERAKPQDAYAYHVGVAEARQFELDVSDEES
jgi:hypothetical protein